MILAAIQICSREIGNIVNETDGTEINLCCISLLKTILQNVINWSIIADFQSLKYLVVAKIL